jgi:two-component system, chemotaxis family, protein-glutamate methylesterase/glutaminase
MIGGRRIRILIVDDSVVIRSLLRSVIGSDAGLEWIGSASDGESALRAIEDLHPDLVLLDVEMPVMDGLATLREVRRRGYKLPVIMCSSLTNRGASVTIEALASGASDYIAKPVAQSGREAAAKALAQELIPRIYALTGHAQPHLAASGALFCGGPAPPPVSLPLTMLDLPRQKSVTSEPMALVIGVSTGGPAALDVLLPGLPESFPLPVLVVQHMPEMFTRLFAERLNSRCHLRVREAEEGDQVRPGTISIAPGNWHMEVTSGAARSLHLSQGPLENHCRPAVDVLFRSAAAAYGAGVLAVILTGMGADGMLGCRVLRDRGASVLAQDQATSVVWGMPGAVIHAGLANKVLPLSDIAPEVIRIVTRGQNEATLLRKLAG